MSVPSYILTSSFIGTRSSWRMRWIYLNILTITLPLAFPWRWSWLARQVSLSSECLGRWNWPHCHSFPSCSQGLGWPPRRSSSSSCWPWSGWWSPPWCWRNWPAAAQQCWPGLCHIPGTALTSHRLCAEEAFFPLWKVGARVHSSTSAHRRLPFWETGLNRAVDLSIIWAFAAGKIVTCRVRQVFLGGEQTRHISQIVLSSQATFLFSCFKQRWTKSCKHFTKWGSYLSARNHKCRSNMPNLRVGKKCTCLVSWHVVRALSSSRISTLWRQRCSNLDGNIARTKVSSGWAASRQVRPACARHRTHEMDVPVNLAFKACCCSPKANLFLEDPGSWTGGYNFYQSGNGEVERVEIRMFKLYILLLNIVCDCINILLHMLTYLPVVYFCLFLQFIHDVFVYLLCPCDFGCDGEGLPTWWLSRANEQSKLLTHNNTNSTQTI